MSSILSPDSSDSVYVQTSCSTFVATSVYTRSVCGLLGMDTVNVFSSEGLNCYSTDERKVNDMAPTHSVSL